MQYAILLEKQADGHYAASVPMLPGVTKIGASRMETLQAIRQAIINTLQQRELVYVDIPDNLIKLYNDEFVEIKPLDLTTISTRE